jgi:Na+-driven multidrug efflux pump
MGAMVDIVVNSLTFLPGILLLARFTTWGPVGMYAVLKLTDVLKITIAAWWLKKERWVRNLTKEYV